MRFNWTFLPTVTIDLQNEKASDMPPLADKNGRFLGLFRDELGRMASVVDRPYSADDCEGAAPVRCFLAPLPIAQFETRWNMTLCARRFGVALRLASTQERDCEDGTASVSGVAHQSGRRRARAGSVKPRRASICANVRTTVSAKRLSRYWYSDRYSHTDDGDEGAVVIACQEYGGG